MHAALAPDSAFPMLFLMFLFLVRFCVASFPPSWLGGRGSAVGSCDRQPAASPHALHMELSPCSALASGQKDEVGVLQGGCRGAAGTAPWLPVICTSLFLPPLVVSDISSAVTQSPLSFVLLSLSLSLPPSPPIHYYLLVLPFR